MSLDVFAEFRRKNAPPIPYMAVQFERFVLGQNENAAHIGVDTVGKREIDDAIRAAEWHGRFGVVARQGVETFSSPSCQQNG